MKVTKTSVDQPPLVSVTLTLSEDEALQLYAMGWLGCQGYLDNKFENTCDVSTRDLRLAKALKISDTCADLWNALSRAGVYWP